jgi:hypothetical protein
MGCLSSVVVVLTLARYRVEFDGCALDRKGEYGPPRRYVHSDRVVLHQDHSLSGAAWRLARVVQYEATYSPSEFHLGTVMAATSLDFAETEN